MLKTEVANRHSFNEFNILSNQKNAKMTLLFSLTLIGMDNEENNN